MQFVICHPRKFVLSSFDIFFKIFLLTLLIKLVVLIHLEAALFLHRRKVLPLDLAVLLLVEMPCSTAGGIVHNVDVLDSPPTA